MVGIRLANVPQFGGIPPVKVSKRIILRRAEVVRSRGVGTARVLAKLDRMVQHSNRKQREHLAARHSESPPRVVRLIPFAHAPSLGSENEEATAELVGTPDPALHGTSLSPTRSPRSGILSTPPPSLSLSRATTRAQPRGQLPESIAVIQRMQRKYFMQRVRRYRACPIVLPTNSDSDDLHMGFAPPPPEHEKHLDMGLQITLFNVMNKLGRKKKCDVEVLEDAVVFRNFSRHEEAEEGESEVLRIWSMFISVWTRFSQGLTMHQ
ncbi:hypothetical protein DFH08DRAFT_1024200 [Mycena albidolilacea]|uniref:Uncharacterized protein n=1 Tax=Mycena albidolilacea TaxID=1033008 RepID=A0AAD7AL60_9AGAR|nr:hypothetical protein DFH08DRAFT_1024200 [Mycena albidolilacea]